MTKVIKELTPMRILIDKVKNIKIDKETIYKIIILL